MLKLNKALKTTLLVSTLALTAFANASYAQNKFDRGGARQGSQAGVNFRVIRQLDLSEEQQAQVKELISAQREIASANRDRIQEARELSEAGSVDQAAEIAAQLAREKVLARAANQQAFEALLTPEQLEELNTIKENGKQRGQRQRNNRSRR